MTPASCGSDCPDIDGRGVQVSKDTKDTYQLRVRPSGYRLKVSIYYILVIKGCTEVSKLTGTPRWTPNK